MTRKLIAAIAAPVLASTVLASVAACGPAATGALGSAPVGSASPSPQRAHTTPAAPSQTTSPPAPTRTIAVQAWFTRSGKLFETQRTVTATRGIGKAAVGAMLAGPNGAEAAAGLLSDVPAGTSMLGLNIASGVATVDLNSAFTKPAAAPVVSLRLAQVVFTLTQFASVRSVHWRVNGQDVTAIAGVPVTGPQTQAAYAADLPPIVVASPVIGTAVTSPVTVSGTADVFEAVVSIVILNAAGTEIARTFTSASCGTGCRGGYLTQVPFVVTVAQKGTVEVFERSAKDGSPVHVQKIPVLLEP